MDLLKQAFEQLDFEKLEETVAQAASAVVEVSAGEYPKPAAEAAARTKSPLLLSPAAAASKAKSTHKAWEDIDWQEQQAQWQAQLQRMDEGGGSPAPEELQQRLHDLYLLLSGLPDPLPAIRNAAALTSKAAELEASCASLQRQVGHLQQDQAEVTKLVADLRAEQAAHAALQAEHAALQGELAAARVSGSSSAKLEQTAKEQEETIESLQSSLASLRRDLEASQSQLFELVAAQEAAAGSASTAEQLAVDEVERLAAEMAELRKAKAQAERQLQELQEQQQRERQEREQQGRLQPAAASAGAPGSPAGGGGAAAAGGDEPRGRSARSPQRGAHGAELAALQADLEAAQEAARDQEHQVALLSAKLAAAESRAARITAELDKRPAASAVAAMAEQLSALSALLGRQLEAEGWQQEPAAAAVAATAQPDQLEPLLQERCRRLDLALQGAKAEAAAASSAAAAAQEQSRELAQQLEQSQALVKQLEADLLAVSTAGGGGAGTASGAAPATAGAGGAAEERQAAAAADEQLSQLVVPGPGAAADAAGVGSGAADGADAAPLLAVVAAQRDRFRARLGEVEGDKAALAGQLHQAQAAAEALRRDNVALVEKVRFLERYKQQAAARGGAGGQQPGGVTVIRVDGAGCVVQDGAWPGAAGSASGAGGGGKAHRYRCGPLSLDLGGAAGKGGGAGAAALRSRGGVTSGGGGGEGPEAAYLPDYEARLNPFAEFQALETESRLQRMQLHDKALLAASRLIAGSRAARAAVAVYLVLLNILIFALMYRSATPHVALRRAAADCACGAGGGGDAVAAARLAAAGAAVAGAPAAPEAAAAAALRLLLEAWRPR